MRDLRNDFLKNIQLLLMDNLEPDKLDLVMAAVSGTLEQYEISERTTNLIARDSVNEKLIKLYAASLVIDGKSKKTIKIYTAEALKFSEFLNGKPFTEVATFDIRNFLAQKKLDGVKNITLENYRSYISAFFQWLTNEEHIQKNPAAAIKPIQCTKEIKTAFSAVEIDKIRSACKNEKERAIVEFLLSSGVRGSELVNLEVSDVDFNTKAVHVRHGKGDKERYTYIDDVAKDHLIRYLMKNKIESGYLFQGIRGQFTRSGINQMVHTIGKRAGVENVHTHRFRRTFATRLAARGMDLQDIQALMGHTNINTTMIYVAMDDSKVNNSYRKYSA